MKTLKKIIFILSILITLFACKNIKPGKPSESYVDTTYRKQLSWVNIPIKIPLTEIEKQVNNEIKGLIYEDSILDDDNIKMKIWKSKKIIISTKDDDYFYFTIPLKIWAMAGFEAESFGVDLSQYKETFFELNLQFKSQIQVTKDWKVAITTIPDGYTWVTKPSIMIGPFEVSITPILNYVLKTQLPELAHTLDQEIQNKLTIKEYIQQTWNTIQTPIQLSKMYNTWIRVTPEEIAMTPIKGIDHMLCSYIGIKGYVESIVGEDPPSLELKKLPSLQLVDFVQDRFQVSMIGEISHSYAKKLVEENFIDKTYSFKDGKYTATIKNVDIYGSNNFLILKLSIIGSKKGDIYLKGKPYFDVQSSSIKIKELDYDIKTKSSIIKVADWLNHSNFIKSIEKSMVMDISKELEETKRIIRQNLNNNRVAKNVLLNGTLDDLIPGEVMITPKSIKAVVFAEGKLQVNIDSF